jgi:ATP-dependent DNA helicase RecG
LLFGADPQRFLPQANATLIRRGDGADPVDTAVASGTFLEQLRLVEEFFLRNLAAQYPMPVVREAVVNALVHRDYSDYTGDVVVRLVDDRAEISSPGLLVGALDVATLEGDAPLTPDRRNPTLVELFFRQTRRIDGGSYIERLGSGIRRMQERLAEHGLPAPEFVEDVPSRRFVVRLRGLRFARPQTTVSERTALNRRQAEFTRLTPAGTRVTAQDYGRRFQVSRGTALSDLNKLAERGLAVRRGSGPATYFEVLGPPP